MTTGSHHVLRRTTSHHGLEPLRPRTGDPFEDAGSDLRRNRRRRARAGLVACGGFSGAPGRALASGVTGRSALRPAHVPARTAGAHDLGPTSRVALMSPASAYNSTHETIPRASAPLRRINGPRRPAAPASERRHQPSPRDDEPRTPTGVGTSCNRAHSVCRHRDGCPSRAGCGVRCQPIIYRYRRLVESDNADERTVGESQIARIRRVYAFQRSIELSRSRQHRTVQQGHPWSSRSQQLPVPGRKPGLPPSAPGSIRRPAAPSGGAGASVLPLHADPRRHEFPRPRQQRSHPRPCHVWNRSGVAAVRGRKSSLWEVPTPLHSLECRLQRLRQDTGDLSGDRLPPARPCGSYPPAFLMQPVPGCCSELVLVERVVADPDAHGQRQGGKARRVASCSSSARSAAKRLVTVRSQP